MECRRVSFWGGPGAGKTSMAHRLCAEMKSGGYRVHFSEESVNAWIYQGRVPPEGYDDLLLFAQQIHAEEVYLNPRKPRASISQATAADFVVTDCPPLMCCVYNQRRKVPYHHLLEEIALVYEEAYSSLNIFVGRPDEFDESERFNTREEAVEIDRLMMELLDHHKLRYHTFHINKAEEAIRFILSEIGPPARKFGRPTGETDVGKKIGSE